MNLALRFLGVGSSSAVELGSSGAVLERDGEPLLLIDCGPETLTRYLDLYGAPPASIYVTHTHLDHVGGFERLFTKLYFDVARRGTTRVFTHAAVVPLLQSRVADYPNVLAEGGANFWDAFRLVPVTRGFWLDEMWFDVFPVRHHAPDTAFALALRGSFVWTGDTRPIPEMLSRYAAAGELVAHDCGLVGNPSHSGLDDVEREYPVELRSRLVLYHYGSASDGVTMAARGYRVAKPGERIALKFAGGAPHAEPSRVPG